MHVTLCALGFETSIYVIIWSTFDAQCEFNIRCTILKTKPQERVIAADAVAASSNRDFHRS